MRRDQWHTLFEEATGEDFFRFGIMTAEETRDQEKWKHNKHAKDAAHRSS